MTSNRLYWLLRATQPNTQVHLVGSEVKEEVTFAERARRLRKDLNKHGWNQRGTIWSCSVWTLAQEIVCFMARLRMLIYAMGRSFAGSPA